MAAGFLVFVDAKLYCFYIHFSWLLIENRNASNQVRKQYAELSTVILMRIQVKYFSPIFLNRTIVNFTFNNVL